MRTSLFITRMRSCFNIKNTWNSAIPSFSINFYRIPLKSIAKFDILTMLHGLYTDDEIAKTILEEIGMTYELDHNNKLKDTSFPNVDRTNYKNFYKTYVKDLIRTNKNEIRYSYSGNTFTTPRKQGIDSLPTDFDLIKTVDNKFLEYFQEDDTLRNFCIYYKTILKEETGRIPFGVFTKRYFPYDHYRAPYNPGIYGTDEFRKISIPLTIFYNNQQEYGWVN